MKITYISHSGFAIECENGITLVFDFFNDTQEVMKSILERSKQVYVFVSHSHPDHFNHRIFMWQENYTAQFSYILSQELFRKFRESDIIRIPENAIHMRCNESFSDEHISVHSFGSTDIGVSYMVDIDGKHIFHAGDLNNWHWSEESTEQEIKAAEGNFLAILRDIKAYTPDIYLAMFPVDPRLGGDFSLGARQFLSAIRAEHFIPMHQWGDFEHSCQFDLYKSDFGTYHCMHESDSIII